MSVTFSEIMTMLASRPTRAILASRPQKAHHPRVALYAASYGTTEAQATRNALDKIASGEHALNRLGKLCNSDVRVYELDLEGALQPLNESQAAHAISYGLMAVDETIDVLVLDTLSMGSETTARLLLPHLKTVSTPEQALHLVAQAGMLDVCAMLGAVMAARMAGAQVWMSDHPVTQLVNQIFIGLCAHDASESPVHLIAQDAAVAETHSPLHALLALHRQQALWALAAAKPTLVHLSSAA